MRLKTKFQDEDFDLGEIVEGAIVECLGKYEEELRVIATATKGGQHTFYYSSIKKFMDDWEDAPEGPKEWWYIDIHGPHKVTNNDAFHQRVRDASKKLGNYFESEEETKKGIEKLKAFKRLKDKGFRFTLTPGVGSLDITPDRFQIEINADMPAKWFCCDAVQEDLNTCFGGEDEAKK